MLTFLQTHDWLLTLIFTGAVAISTIVYAVLTWRLAGETRELRKAQTEPKVVAFVALRENAANISHLYIENIGAGAAFNINFTFGDENEGGKLLIKDFSQSPFLEKGLEFLGPKQKKPSFFSSALEEKEIKKDASFRITIKYENSIGEKYRDSYTIDMSEFEGAIAWKSSLETIANNLEKIQKDIHHSSTGFRRLRVDSYTQEDRDREREAREKRIKEMKSQKDGKE